MTAVAVHFARVTVLGPVEREPLIAVLSEGERVRLGRLRVGADRDAWLVTHALARRVLGEHLGVAPRAVPLGTDAAGKPVLAAPNVAWRVSLTHTHGLAACAVAEGVDVGVDAEDLDRRVDVERVARRALMPSELAARAGLDGVARRDRFFELWTLREAIAKATGAGLGRTLGKVELDLDGERVGVRFAPGAGDARQWSFARHRPSERHVLAVAAQAPDALFRFEARRATG